MYDAHCHLADNKFNNDVEEVIRRAKNEGVGRIVVVAEYPTQFEKIIELCRKYPDILAAGVGVHPIQKRNKSVQMKQLNNVESFIMDHRKDIVCVGEVGLDFHEHYKTSEEDRRIQEDVFRAQIQIAKKLDLPLNIHSRSAASRTLEILVDERVDKDQAILHAFDGNKEDVQVADKNGYILSVPPSFCYDNDRIDVLKNVRPSQLLLESDAPALGPVKGIRNEPSNLSHSLKAVAKIINKSTSEALETTNINFHRVFKCI